MLQRLRDKNRAADEGPSDIEETMDDRSRNRAAAGPGHAKGHHIGAADDNNFEFGLECILDHAERLIETTKRSAKPAQQAAPQTAISA